jgi:hypothetical protein
MESLVIMRTHNESRGLFADYHIMKVLDREEIKHISEIPYYEGKVYRAHCKCGKNIDRKTLDGLRYAMNEHLSGDKIPDKHSFYEQIWDPDYWNEHTRKYGRFFDGDDEDIHEIDRREYVVRTKDPERAYYEQMKKLNLTEADIPKTTALVSVDPNILWDNSTRSFNHLDVQVFRQLKPFKYGIAGCPQCSEDFDRFRELYWHFYHEHYKNNKFKRDIEFNDVALSMIQQFVLVEQTIENVSRKSGKFKKDRMSNALYHLNRKHGISMNDLQKQLEYMGRFMNIGSVGERLFHGMVWSEHQAPKWLDKVIAEFGQEIGI